jgi:hypothetical protein
MTDIKVYKVLLERPVYEFVWVDVDAVSENDAYNQAMELNHNELFWEPDYVGDVSAVDCYISKSEG